MLAGSHANLHSATPCVGATVYRAHQMLSLLWPTVLQKGSVAPGRLLLYMLLHTLLVTCRQRFSTAVSRVVCPTMLQVLPGSGCGLSCDAGGRHPAVPPPQDGSSSAA
jgi:hypothetical protein